MTQCDCPTDHDHLIWQYVAHKFSITLVMCSTSLKPIIQLLQEAAYYSKNYSQIFGPGLPLFWCLVPPAGQCLAYNYLSKYAIPAGS